MDRPRTVVRRCSACPGATRSANSFFALVLTCHDIGFRPGAQLLAPWYLMVIAMRECSTREDGHDKWDYRADPLSVFKIYNCTRVTRLHHDSLWRLVHTMYWNSSMQKVASIFSGTAATRRKPFSPRVSLIIALSVGLVSGMLCYRLLCDRGFLAGDFTWPYRGAERLLAGLDPYHDPALGPGKPYPFENQLPYPMPALFIAAPFTAFSAYRAGALFFGLSSALLAFGLARSDQHHRWWLFLSPSFHIAAMVAQWSPLLMAAVFLPWLAPVTIAKPNIGIPLLALWPRKLKWIVATIVFGLISLAIMPSWPFAWLKDAAGTNHWPALIIPPGFVLLLALKRWRTREGQLLLWLAFVPQFLFWYDQLLLWLIPRTHRQSLMFLLSSWAGYEVWTMQIQGSSMGLNVLTAMPVVIATVYIPALILVLWQSRDELNDSHNWRTWRTLIANAQIGRFPLPHSLRSSEPGQRTSGES